MDRSDETSRPKYKTCRRYNDAGHAHSLTFCCFQRRKFLARDRARQWFVDAVNLAREKHAFDVWAYAIMPEHVHLLVCPTRREYDVSKFLATLKQSITRKAAAFLRSDAPRFLEVMLDVQPNGRRSLRFWQRGGGFDRNLWSDKAIAAEIDYIHANPVRRGLCRRPEEWLWSSAGDYARLREGPIKIDFQSLPRLYG